MNERIEAPEEEPMEGREEVSKSEGASLDEATVDPEARVERRVIILRQRPLNQPS